MRRAGFEVAVQVLTPVLMLAGLCGGVLGCGGGSEQESLRDGGSRQSESTPEAVVAELPTVTLAISGMTCQGCADAIHAKLVATGAVVTDSVSLADSQAVVTYRPGQIDPAGLAEAINALGYRATVR